MEALVREFGREVAAMSALPPHKSEPKLVAERDAARACLPCSSHDTKREGAGGRAPGCRLPRWRVPRTAPARSGGHPSALGCTLRGRHDTYI
jgi:hypothetical protein